MNNALRVIGILIVVTIGCLYVLERHVLVGDLLSQASFHIDEVNPSPNLRVQVEEGEGFARVYLESPDDVEITIRVTDPDGQVLIETTEDIGNASLSFDTPSAGDYYIALRTDNQNATVNASIWKNDRRLFVGWF